MTRPDAVEVHLLGGEEGCRWAREHKAVAVVVDALRASATITLLLQQGASEVIVMKEVDEAYAYRTAHPDTLLIGERGGLKVKGFDFGNSPTEIRQADIQGKRVAFTSTTGAQRLVDCLGASKVVVGTTINVTAVAQWVTAAAEVKRVPIVVIPAGLATDPSVVAEEDWLGATALVARMGAPIHQQSQEPYQQYLRLIQSTGLLAGFLNASHGQQLVRLGFTDDIQLCAQVDLITDIVPILTAVVPLHNGDKACAYDEGSQNMLRFYNTLTRVKEDFQPIHPGEVRLYTCGPTVYDYAHIGNFRTFVFEDVMRRYLIYKGYRVTQVMNLTDIDDKTIRGARQAKTSLSDYVKFYAQAFFDDLHTLNIQAAEYYPAATEHIPEMVALINQLIERGYAYPSGGSIYFKVDAFPDYGRLSHLEERQLQAGASGRVDADEYEKEDVRDFALWKGWTEGDGDVYWETELGKGRPGWHIECSAMAMKYLGIPIDIHAGGVDLVFPHHENEIAQSEGATGQRFVQRWLHCQHLLVDNQKMSKSLGNFHTLRDLLQLGHKAKVIRYSLLATHYRQSQNFTVEGLTAAEAAVQRLQDFMTNLQTVEGHGASLDGLISKALRQFEEGMDDDLNISLGLAAIFEFVREVNRLLAAGELSPENAQAAVATMRRFDQVLGLLDESEVPVGVEAQHLLQQREQARKRHDFATADRLRTEISAMGYVVEDTPKGPRLKRL